MHGERATTDPADWFLTAAERRNPATGIDRRRNGGLGWTAGNEVVVHVDGAAYFTRLHEVLRDAVPGDHVWFTDWAGNADERLAGTGTGTEVSRVLGALAERGVAVRGLLWRSHPKEAGFDLQDNLSLAAELNEHGASLMLDQRVRRLGSHHQKLVVVLGAGGGPTGGPAGELAFVGGIDLCHGRRDDRDHHGDPQAADELDERYGEHPKDNISKFISAIEKIDEVVECHHVTGQADFILKVVAPDIPAYQNLMLEKVTNIEVVDNLQSTVILSTFKDSKVVPIP